MNKTNNSNQKIRVLFLMKDLRIGNGIASCIMNYYDALIMNNIYVDFLVYLPSESLYSEKATENGNIYIMPMSNTKWSKNRKAYVRNILLTNRYDIVHVNLPGV